jgi:hypothetical protein
MRCSRDNPDNAASAVAMRGASAGPSGALRTASATSRLVRRGDSEHHAPVPVSRDRGREPDAVVRQLQRTADLSAAPRGTIAKRRQSR